VTTDAAGVAQVGIQALVDVTTQPAQIRATDVATGQALIGNFTIVRNQDGSQFITVIPDTATITSPTTSCSAGAVVDYRIYGGTPPYRVTSSFPGAVSILNSTVAASGGFFEVRTNGTCVDPLTFSILDSAGKQTTATLTNSPGSGSGGGGGTSSLVVTPVNQGNNTTSCAGTFTVSISGGTPPYNISQTSTSVAPYALANFPNTLAAAGTASFSGLTGPSGSAVTYTFFVSDSQFSPVTGTDISITCLVP
jgi:hypothetical protein